MIVEDAALLEDAERSQVMGSKHKEGVSIDKEGYWPLKKAKEKYCGCDTVKIESTNPYE